MPSRKLRIALQLYSVRDECSKDLFKTLEAVAEMGFEGVEFAGYYGKSAGDIRDKLRDLGLEIAGAHESIQKMSGNELEKTLRYNMELGNNKIVIPWLPPEMRSDKRDWINSARLISEIADKAAVQGFRIGYHNHREEFIPVNGEYPWYIFFDNASRSVFMQLDTGNALSAGIPHTILVETLKRYPNRAQTIHLKDYSHRHGFVILGEGDVPFKEVLEACREAGGTEWLIVEQETYPYPPLESARRCIENLKKIL
ncbi:Inosose dehydratase [Candidatus Calditenuaceae archaeon HR02]|nr:Inosose dehydratase [Candidatus Calditenuaceae archaeon HR02]